MKNDLGDKQEAVKDYNKAIELNPNDVDAYNNRGILKYEIGNQSGACEDWSKAGELGEMRAYELIKEYCK